MIDTPDYSFNQKQEEEKIKSQNLLRQKIWRLLIYTLLLIFGGSLSYGWYFLTQKLVPLIEKPVSNFLSMDVDLGEVEAVSFNSIRINKSEIKTRKGDNDYAVAEDVIISLKPMQLLQKKIALDIYIIKPVGYLQQNNDNSWLKLKLKQLKSLPYGFHIKVDKISLTQGLLTAESKIKNKDNISKGKISNAIIQFSHSQNWFNVKGKLIDGGNFTADGINNHHLNQWLINLSTDNLPTDTLTKLNLLHLPISFNDGNLVGNLSLDFRNLRLKEIKGLINLDDVTLKIPSLSQPLKNTLGKITFAGENINIHNISAKLGLIPLIADGVINHQQKTLNLAIQTDVINIKDSIKTFNLPQPVVATEGKVKGELTVSGNLTKPLVKGVIENVGNLTLDKIEILSASANINVFNSQLTISDVNVNPLIGGKVKGKGNISLDNQQPTFNLNLQTSAIPAEKLTTTYQQNLPIPIGLLTGEYNITGSWRQLANTRLTGITSFPIAEGKATIKDFQLQNNQWQGKINLSGVRLSQIPIKNKQLEKVSSLLSKLENETVFNGEFQVSGKLGDMATESLNLVGDGEFNLADGMVKLNKIKLNQGLWQTSVLADNLAIEKIPFIDLASLNDNQTEITGLLSGELLLQGNINQPQEIDIQGKGIANLPQGKINLNSFSVVDKNVTANVGINQFPLKGFNQELTGKATGEIIISGKRGKNSVTTSNNNNQLPITDLKIKGDLAFSEGIGKIKQPLKTTFHWQGGNQLFLDKATIQGISATGLINYDFDTQKIKQVDLAINAQDINLTQLPLPPQLNLLGYKGKINFQGNLVGDLSQPQLKGKVNLNQFTIANLPFDNLTGNLTASSEKGIDIKLTSPHPQSKDKLAIQLDKNYQPQTINLIAKETHLTATRQQNNLNITVDNLSLNNYPLENFIHQLSVKENSNIPKNLPKIGGKLSANINLNLDTFDFNAPQITINQPSLNHLQGDLLTAKLSSSARKITITEGKLTHDKNKYDFTASGRLDADNPEFKGELTVAEGDIQDMLMSLEIFELADIFQGIKPRIYAKAIDLYEENHQSNSLVTEFQSKTNNNLSSTENDSDVVTRSESKENSNSDVVTRSESKENSNTDVVTRSESKENSNTDVVTRSESKENSNSDVVTRPESKENSNLDVVTRPESKENSNSDVVTRPESKENSNSDVVTRPESKENSNLAQPPLAEIDDTHLSLQQRFDLLNTITNQLEQQENQENTNSALPPLANLDGKFKGKINISFTPQTGINADFDFQGNEWQWQKYEADFLQVKGNYKNGLLTLLPITIQQNEGIISLTGTFKPEQILGQIIVENLPFTEVSKAVNFPENIKLDGKINANIAISGDQEYPLAKGSVAMDDVEINKTQIDSITSSFGYKNSKMTFLANSNLQENEKTLTITGNFPFQLFDNSMKPETEEFDINLTMTKNGFKLLNIISNNQLNWIEGEGNINLDIAGIYQQQENKIRNLQTQGIVNVENGTMTANILPDKPLTNINGKILFNFDQLTVDNLAGDFSGGNIHINGNLPLTEDTIQGENLNINMDNIALNLKPLYQGNAQGNLVISGKAISPEISGDIEIFDGEINLTKRLNNSQDNIKKESLLAQTKINNLNLNLGKNIAINQLPLLTLKAQGNINLNGDLKNLKPEGLITLTSGTINLFTSQLKLAPSYQNIARLTPENGFNPYLDLELEGSVTETSRYQFVDNTNPNEIKDISNSSINTAQTIRVKARVQGLSNNIENKLDLTSSPTRSKSEIIALLGGGFFNNFAGGDSNLGLANLASAAFLGSFQGQLGEALGFDEFRFFPTQILDPDKRTSSIGFGTEIGLNLTNNFSVSVFKILTNDQQPQYSIRYRVNDQINLRTSTDFAEDSRGAIEFQYRF